MIQENHEADATLSESEFASQADIAPVVDDVRDFFESPKHWIYTSRGTASDIGPRSSYHIGQLQVLFEDKHFHFRTMRAIRQMREEGFLKAEVVPYDGSMATVVWQHSVRYTRRLIRDHVRLIREYSMEAINKATGDYAETLTLMGLSLLRFDLIARSSREYRGKVWTETDHDLDFIFERDGAGYGVEVKNTWTYFPSEELTTKLSMCEHLGLRPLFIARNRHSGQWEQVRDAGGLLYIFKSKVFPPGQEDLVHRIWREMRLPVAIWNDWPQHFYRYIKTYLGNHS